MQHIFSLPSYMHSWLISEDEMLTQSFEIEENLIFYRHQENVWVVGNADQPSARRWPWGQRGHHHDASTAGECQRFS